MVSREDYPEWDKNWCPLCEKFAKTTLVEDFTYPNDDYSLARIRQRLRLCNSCEIHFETFELDKDEFHNYILLKEKFAQIRRIVSQEDFSLNRLKKVILADSLIEVEDPEIWDKIEKAESEFEVNLIDDAESDEIFSNWDPDL